MLRRIISFILSAAMLLPSLIGGFGGTDEKLRVVVPEDWELCVGDSRTLECVFDEDITDRQLEFSVEPADVASVDKWGRVTAIQVGKAVVTAKGNGFEDSVELSVVETPTLITSRKETVEYSLEASEYGDNLQKIVAKYSHNSADVPSYIKSVRDYSSFKTAVTADGAVWEITEYGVLRTDKNASNERDVYQRFMGDRYFYSNDSTNVRGIFPDGENGIWTVTDAGISHIMMIAASGEFKAEYMSENTQNAMNRHGLINEAYIGANGWYGTESDNDGLWTSMYGAGELMRYATLKADPNTTEQELAKAKQAAYSSAEAVLLLYYISMRSGTTEAYVRAQTNENIPGTVSDRYLSADALEKGGNPSWLVPQKSPSQLYQEGRASLFFLNSASKIKSEGFYTAVSAEDWSDPAENPDTEYEMQTRLIEGFPARTFRLKTENGSFSDNIYWSVNSDATATGISDKAEGTVGYLINNENLRGVTVDASHEVPERLWNDLIGEEYSPEDIIYKTDTSADELVGHMFIFKLIYDVLAPEDEEIKELLIEAVDGLAQHLSDNSYMLCDATGQPTSWGNFGRTVYCAGTSVAQSPLHALVLLDIFKTAAYITGYQKWENEYRMAALDPAYEYAEVVAQYYDRMMTTIELTVANETIPLVGNIIEMLGNTKLVESVYRLVINYSDEEMAALGFYNIFQLEEDEKLLDIYRDAFDQWWLSMRYSENPLWYYIYQLAYPNKTIKDAYGNNILDTAAWSLSRQPADTVMYCATNSLRDDVANLDFSFLGLNMTTTLCYNLQTSKALPEIGEDADVLDIVNYILTAVNADWAVAAPDERSLHRFNDSSYHLGSYHRTNCMQPSTNFTLPYWMGVYHGMLCEE